MMYLNVIVVHFNFRIKKKKAVGLPNRRMLQHQG
jgi:hypothetical protein